MERFTKCQVIAGPYSVRISLIEASLFWKKTLLFPLFLLPSTTKNPGCYIKNILRRIWKVEIGRPDQLGTSGPKEQHRSPIYPRLGAEGDGNLETPMSTDQNSPGKAFSLWTRHQEIGSLARQKTFANNYSTPAKRHRRKLWFRSYPHPQSWAESLESHPHQAVTTCLSRILPLHWCQGDIREGWVEKLGLVSHQDRKKPVLPKLIDRFSATVTKIQAGFL